MNEYCRIPIGTYILLKDLLSKYVHNEMKKQSCLAYWASEIAEKSCSDGQIFKQFLEE